MLSIFLAEELERVEKESQDTIFIEYFCDNKDEKRNTAVGIFRGLVFQLLNKRKELFTIQCCGRTRRMRRAASGSSPEEV
jgi:hypothetical protein